MGSYLLVMISQVLSKTKTKQAKDTSIINMKEIYIYIYISLNYASEKVSLLTKGLIILQTKSKTVQKIGQGQFKTSL